MSNCNMPVNLLPLAGAGLGFLQQSKQEKAAAGIKTYTKPKTIFGKLIGGISGRTAAAETTDMYNKTAPIPQSVMNSLGQAKTSQGLPFSGGIDIGGEATRKTYLPFYAIAAVVAIFYFMRRKGGRRRY